MLSTRRQTSPANVSRMFPMMGHVQAVREHPHHTHEQVGGEFANGVQISLRANLRGHDDNSR